MGAAVSVEIPRPDRGTLKLLAFVLIPMVALLAPPVVGAKFAERVVDWPAGTLIDTGCVTVNSVGSVPARVTDWMFSCEFPVLDIVNVWDVPVLPTFIEPKSLVVGLTLATAGSNWV